MTRRHRPRPSPAGYGPSELAELAGLAELSGLAELIGLAELSGLAELIGLAELSGLAEDTRRQERRCGI
jgi:hypothetical protein